MLSRLGAVYCGLIQMCALVIPLGVIILWMFHPFGAVCGCLRYMKLSRYLCGGWILEMSCRWFSSSVAGMMHKVVGG